jgi:adenosine kinase
VFVASSLIFHPSVVMSILVGVENPLLDITVSVDSDFLKENELEANSAILAEPLHLPLLESIKSFPSVFYSAGGATQNAMRVAQWMLGTPNRVTYMGCVGDDENMRIMKRAVETEGNVEAVYQIHPTAQTGTCGVFLSNNGKDRSLIAHLGAANHLHVSHLESHRSDILDKASVVYSSGFLVTSSEESLRYLAKFCRETGKTFVLNLGAPFICEVPPFREILMDVMADVNYVIGSDAEAVALGVGMGWIEETGISTESLVEVAKKPSLPNRTVIITAGSSDTIVVSSSNGHTSAEFVPIVKVPETNILDANGCGDAYAGGFCGGLLLGRSVFESCSAGAYAASVVIQHRGCTVPGESEFQF